MDVFTFLVIIYSLVKGANCLENTLEESFSIQILPQTFYHGQQVVLKQVDETLYLYCKATTNRSSSNYKLTWKLPHLTHNSQNRVAENSVGEDDTEELVIRNLKESDSGDYECVAQTATQPGVVLERRTVRVAVKNRKARCDGSSAMFSCQSGSCIFQRYTCDGFEDCRDGSDENSALCGPDPCREKVPCPDGRCIPREACCDPYADPDCAVKVRSPCCPPLVLAGGHAYPKYNVEDRGGHDDQQRFSDMGFLQTTIYTVIGCAMAFMFIVTILVIAICRVHMKRALLSRCPGQRGGRGGVAGGRQRGPPHPHHHHGVSHVPLYDLDVFLNRGSPCHGVGDPSPPGGFLVTYNINNGVQFVGRPVDPPPYCEVVASPPREGPPPPYASRESLGATAAEESESATERDSLLSPARPPGPGVTGALRITVVSAAPFRAVNDLGAPTSAPRPAPLDVTNVPPTPTNDLGASPIAAPAAAPMAPNVPPEGGKPCNRDRLRRDFFSGLRGGDGDGDPEESGSPSPTT